MTDNAANQPVRFGLVGAGAIAQTWALAFRATDAAELTAVCDIRREAASALAEPFDAAVYDDASALAASGRCEAIVVCSPPTTHVDVALAAVDNGVAVLCEKPLAVDCPSATKMVSAAASAGVLLTMASKFRFVDDVIRARSMATSGLLGEIVMFSNGFASPVDMRNRWNADPAISGGGVIIDNGTHSVDIARYLLGPIAEVFAVDATRRLDLPVEDSARIMLRSTGGTVGAITLSWVLESFSNTYLELLGSEGSLRVGYSRSRFRQSSSPQWIEFGAGYNKVTAHSRQLENFAGALRGTAELIVTPSDALASVSAIEAAYASISSGSWSPVSPDCS
jgi:predicted dehydrogenase